MENNRWLDFLSSRIRSEIFREYAEKAEGWCLLVLGLVCLGAALKTAAGPENAGTNFYTSKILFLTVFHGILIFNFFLPNLLLKDRRPQGFQVGVRDFTGLVFVSWVFIFYALIFFILSVQLIQGFEENAKSNFFGFLAWINMFVTATYFAGGVFCLLSLFFFPGVVAKWKDKGTKLSYALLGFHAVLFLLMSLSYAGMAPLGSAAFLNDLRLVGLHWIVIAASVVFISKCLQGSVLAGLAALELDLAAGKLQRPEDILGRFEESFIQERLASWLARLLRLVDEKTHEIIRLVHEAMTLAHQEKPSEMDLRHVEDRWRCAEALTRELEKENQRFLLSVSFFQSSKGERVKIEALKDSFSRELRNIKLELFDVRKKIDERLVSLKNKELPLPSSMPLEEVPAGR